MRVQGTNLIFGKADKTKKDRKPNVIGSTLLGATIGAGAGTVAREFAPIPDDFFSKTTKNEVKNNEIKTAVKNFIENYGKEEMEEARVLKTALFEIKEKGRNKKFNKKEINSLVADESISLITKKDSDELQNAVKALKQDIVDDLKETPKGKKGESIKAFSKNVGEITAEAKKSITTKNLLKKYSENIKGIGEKGSADIKTVKEVIAKSIDKASENAKPLVKEVSQGFKSMVKTAAKSQRKKSEWIALPAAALAGLGFGLAAGKKSNIEQ